MRHRNPSRPSDTGSADVVLLVFRTPGESCTLRLLGPAGTGDLLTKILAENPAEVLRQNPVEEPGSHFLGGQQLTEPSTSQTTALCHLEPVNNLTSREMEVLQLVAHGMSNKEIANRLGISVRTVKGHLVSVFAKMKVQSRVQAVISGLRNGFVVCDTRI